MFSKGQTNKFVSIALITTLLVAFISLGSFVAIVYATPSESFYVEGGVYPSAATYSVWREGSTYYAKDAYGHIAFESSNASLVINQALNATETLGGGCVLLLAGIYGIDWPISVGNNTELKGVARDSTILRLNDGATRGMHQSVIRAKYWYIHGGLGYETWNVTIRDLTVDGNNDNNAGYDDCGGLNFGRAPNVLIENLIVKDCTGFAGIYVGPRQANHYNSTTVIRNCIVFGTDSYDAHATYGNGIYATAHRNGSVLIENNYCYNNFWAGIINEDLSNQTIIRGNVCYGNLGAGISNANANHAIITNNVCFGNLRGISGTATYNSIISNNLCEFNTYQGIYFTAKSNFTIISNNMVKNNGQIGQGGFTTGIQVDDSDDCLISNNICVDDLAAWRQWTGITTTGTTNNTIIIGNNCRDNGGVGITVVGAGDKVNLCWNGSTWIS